MIGYRTSAITYAIARRVVKIPHIGLVNVVAGERFRRSSCRMFVPSAVADALMPLLDVQSDVRARPGGLAGCGRTGHARCVVAGGRHDPVDDADAQA